MRPNVLLVVLDCLRLDFWRREMPLTRKVTKGWFHFENHWAVAHCSDPNHAALFTGFGPWQTNVTTQMSKSYTTALPTLQKRWGPEVGGKTWSVQPLMVPSFYRHGFDLAAWHKGVDSADLEIRAVRQFTRECSNGKPWLGFVRSMTCHYPYLDLPSPPRGSGGALPQYQAAVNHEDKFVHNLVEFILAEHPDTIVVLCADHGELLGEHDQWDHLYTLYSILTRVPMAVYVPGLPGKRTRRPTQHVDVWLTLCDLLDLDLQGEGFSWAGWMRGEARYPADRDRILWLQGTGAGPNTWKMANAAPHLDPGVGRVLWRHRGIVAGNKKLVENIYATGDRDTLLTNSADFREHSKSQKVSGTKGVGGRLYPYLPPVPDYHDWEEKLVRAAKDDVILDRLRALGYA